MAYRTKRLSGTLGIAAAILLFGSQHLAYGQREGQDLVALKAQMRVLEAVVNETLAQTFVPPFGVLEKAKGSYLPDFGVVFSLEVNLYPIRVPSPFDMRPLSKEELEKARKAKLERIGIIKQTLPRLLADHASALRELSANDSIAVVVHLFYVPVEGDNLPSQVVIEVKKSDLEQFWDKKLSFEELHSRVRTLEL
jgi:hypothetical protein